MTDRTISHLVRITGWAAVAAHAMILAGIGTLIATGGFGA